MIDFSFIVVFALSLFTAETAEIAEIKAYYSNFYYYLRDPCALCGELSFHNLVNLIHRGES